MNLHDLFEAANRGSIRDQIIADVKKHGGSPKDYFVRFTGIDKLGYSSKQWFGRSPDVDDPKFSPDYIGAGKGRPALWFYPLSFYLADRNPYATEQPYAWLVKIRPDAWLQPVNYKTKGIEPAPQGKQRVGLMRQTSTPAAIFFQPEFDVVGKYYDYARFHKRHGEVKGAPPKSFFDRVRGH